MRVTSFMIYDQVLRSLQNGEADYATLTERLATSKRILSPSDDVIGALRSMDYRVRIKENDQYKRNIEGAVSNLSITETVLGTAYDAVRQVKDVLTTVRYGTADAGVRAAYAQETAQLRDHLHSLANTKITDRYLFSGFRTNVEPYGAAWYGYQGDSGVINVPIGQESFMPINITGEESFSYTPPPGYTAQLSSGQNAHYSGAGGTTTVVEIRDATDTVVLSTFGFSNVIQLTDIISSAIAANDSVKLEALIDPLNKMHEQMMMARTEAGARMSSLKDQKSMLLLTTNAVKNSLSATENADINETAIQLQKSDVALQALRSSASKLLSQSLFDFLR